MAGQKNNRLLVEQALPQDGHNPEGREAQPGKAKVAHSSVTVNLAESPLGWLKARGGNGSAIRCWRAASRRLGAGADGAENDHELGCAANWQGGARRPRWARSNQRAN